MPFDRSEFSAWYDDYVHAILRPGTPQVVRAVEMMLDANFRGRTRDRYRLGRPRLKSANRAFTKLAGERYVERISTPSDAAVVLDDLLGIRIICTNLSDVFALRDAFTEYFAIVPFSGTTGDGGDSYAIEENSIRNYISREDKPSADAPRQGPKESGYRAFHLNLMTQVARPGGGWEVVRCEVQIRTLLQESWGELTHEDTYKPGGAVSDLVETLSRRMAEVLAVMDDLAQDLRTELDRQVDESVDGIEGTGGVGLGASGAPTGGSRADELSVDGRADLRPAVRRFVEDRYNSLHEPLPLASLAQELRGEFGASLYDGWLGHERMAPMLREMLPEGAVANTVPGMLVPRDFRAAEAVSAGAALVKATLPADVPEVALALKAFDGSFPLLSSQQIGLACKYLADADIQVRADHVAGTARYVNQLTKLARSLAQSDGVQVSRAQLDYIATALRFGGMLAQELTPESIRDHYAKFVLNRFLNLGLVPGSDSEQAESVRRWLRGE